MTEVKRVFAQDRAHADGEAGRVTEGYYIIDRGVLIMTHSDGLPVDEFRFRHKLQPADNPDGIAVLLTRKVRNAMKGVTPDEEAFVNHPLDYGSRGVA